MINVKAAIDRIVTAIAGLDNSITGTLEAQGQPAQLVTNRHALVAGAVKKLTVAQPRRASLALLPTVDCVIGPAGVTSGTGFALKAGQAATLFVTGEVYALSTEPGDVMVLEEVR
ncbi:hypothetical protein [Ferrimonas balearica]|uniref:hypothetical protein n=1 Tax=Ferrimonas balearica TaxID=44012 RepID=UPI001F34E35B|nr:hypothetical protein [Ferrimonas balearica]MBY6095124.1 hypothetical protein [Ferrimonas balearica]